MTNEGTTKLISHEGEVLHAYTDSEGYLTIGIGHLIDKRKGGAITQRVSRILFEDDIAFATASARANFEWVDGLDPVRQDVIVMLVFNMGVAGVAKFKNMIKHIIAHNFVGAAYELFHSQWRFQVGKTRSDDLCSALEHGAWNENLRKSLFDC